MAPAVKRNVNAMGSEIRKQITALVTAAFGFVAALSWNDAIKSMIAAFIPAQNAWPYLVLNACVVTVIAVLAIVLISRYMKP
jgi:uncharacterized membrane protein YidH (DUF202 family)